MCNNNVNQHCKLIFFHDTGKFEFGLKSGRSASNVAVASTATEMHHISLRPSVDKNPKKQRRNKGSKVKKSEANSEKNDIKDLLPDFQLHGLCSNRRHNAPHCQHIFSRRPENHGG